MIQEMPGLPQNVAGFKATGQVTKDDFTQVVIPRVQQLVDQEGELNYLLVLETPLKNFTFQSWMQDLYLGVKHLLKWNRVAIVSDKESVRTFTDIFSKLAPGEFRGYAPEELDIAVAWVSGRQPV